MLLCPRFFCHLHFEREKFCGNFGDFFLAFFLLQFCVQQTKRKLQTLKGKLYINTARNGCERFYSNGVEYYKAVRFKNSTVFSSCHNLKRTKCNVQIQIVCCCWEGERKNVLEDPKISTADNFCKDCVDAIWFTVSGWCLLWKHETKIVHHHHRHRHHPYKPLASVFLWPSLDQYVTKQSSTRYWFTHANAHFIFNSHYFLHIFMQFFMRKKVEDSTLK